MSAATPFAEIWREIPGYEGLYEASNLGRIRSIARTVELINRYGQAATHSRQSVELIPAGDRNGRLQVTLSREGKSRTFGVGRLILESFGQPSPPGWWITYADEEPGNCALANLSWRPRGSTRARAA